MKLAATFVLALAACGAPAYSGEPVTSSSTTASRPRLVLVSIDGMMPDVIPSAPTLRGLAHRGASARIEGVFPTVTYPSHTTIVTGVPPRLHGITRNRPVDPLDKNFGGWHWYAEDITAPTLWQAALARKRTVALVTWPVTVGAKATFVVPEYWRSGTVDDQKLLRALSTPGLLDNVAREFPALWTHLVPPDVHDDAQFAIARYLVAHEDVDLLLVHAWGLDDAQHAHGPGSPEAAAALAHADALLGDLVALIERTPGWDRTTLAVVSDHGFARVDHEVRLNALFVKHGLIQLDADGKTTAARVAVVGNGGSAFIYVLDPAARPDVDRALAELGPIIGQRFEHAAIVDAGGDPTATLAVAAARGYAFDDARTGAIVRDVAPKGNHGYPPSDPAMAAAFVAVGPGIAHRDLGTVRMIDIAPTLAQQIDVPLPSAVGHAITLR